MTRRRFLVAAVAAPLAGCGALVRRPPAPLELKLSPASLGRELTLQSRMTVTSHGRAEQFDVVLEADAAAVRLAVLAFGQTLARLEWDGVRLHEERAPGWPPEVRAASVLRDVQLVHWPAAAIAPALPAGWTLREEHGARELLREGRPVLRVRHPGPDSAELDNLAEGYQVRLNGAGSAP